MKSISIVFSTRSGFNLFSLLIKAGLKTTFSHVAVKMIDGDTGQVVYYQASGLSVNVVSESEFLGKETIIYSKEIQVSDTVFIAGKTWSISQLGKPYDLSAILGFAIQITLGMMNIKIKNPFKANGSEYVCSQFAAAYIEAADNIDLDVTEMTPLALYNIMPTLPESWI